MVLPPPFLLHNRLADMNNLGRALAKAMNPKDLFRFPVEQDLQRAHAHADDLRPCQMFKLRAAHFMRYLHGGQLLLGFTDGADFRDGIDTRWGYPRSDGQKPHGNQRLRGDATLIVSG